MTKEKIKENIEKIENDLVYIAMENADIMRKLDEVKKDRRIYKIARNKNNSEKRSLVKLLKEMKRNLEEEKKK